jgi:hypothetical protein
MRGTKHPRIRPIGSKRTRDSSGCSYIQIKVREPDFWVYEHRFLMEQNLGRPLKPSEVVHHKDSNLQNNSIGNLVLLKSQAEHARMHRAEER